MKFKRWVIVSLLLTTLFLLTSCSGPDEHIWLKTPGWSRAAFLGNTAINDPVPMATDSDGNFYFALFSADSVGEEKTLNVVARDGSGNPLWTKALDEISFHRPDSPQIVWEADSLHIFWMEGKALYSLVLDQDAQILSEPKLLSADIVVGSYSLAVDSSGGHTLWLSGPRENTGVYALSSLDGTGDLLPVDPEGMRAQLRYDQDDNLHATWLQYPLGYGRSQILYAFYPAGSEISSIRPQAVYELSVGPSNSLDGPALGIDEDTAYLFWAVIVRTGLDAGAVQTAYLHFPLGEPAQASKPAKIVVPSDYSFEYEPFARESLLAGDRVLLENAVGFRTHELKEFVPTTLQAGELGMIFRAQNQYLWRKVRDQVDVVYFDAGQATSYQPLTFTPALSTSPNLYNDSDGYLYGTWLEKIETDFYAVYFASTAPAIEETFNQSSGRELGRIFAQASFGMLVGTLMAPIAAGVLVIAPLGILFLFAPFRKKGSLRVQNVFSIISLLFAIAAFWVGKFAVFPAMLDYVPFSAWVPEIAPLLSEILRYGVPVLTALIAFFVAWFYTYRQSNKSTLYFILIYVGVDSLITAAIYAVLIYGAI